MEEIARELRLAVDDASRRLATISEDKASHPVTLGKWSPKEIIGHLVDSAPTITVASFARSLPMIFSFRDTIRKRG